MVTLQIRANVLIQSLFETPLPLQFRTAIILPSIFSPISNVQFCSRTAASFDPTNKPITAQQGKWRFSERPSIPRTSQLPLLHAGSRVDVRELLASGGEKLALQVSPWAHQASVCCSVMRRNSPCPFCLPNLWEDQSECEQKEVNLSRGSYFKQGDRVCY